MDCLFIGRHTTVEYLDQATRFCGDKQVIMAIDEIPRKYPLPIDRYGSVMTYDILFGSDDLKIIFTNELDYNECSDILPQKNQAVIIEKPRLSQVSVKMLKTAEIFLADKGNVRKAKNAELQQFIR